MKKILSAILASALLVSSIGISSCLADGAIVATNTTPSYNCLQCCPVFPFQQPSLNQTNVLLTPEAKFESELAATTKAAVTEKIRVGWQPRYKLLITNKAIHAKKEDIINALKKAEEKLINAIAATPKELNTLDKEVTVEMLAGERAVLEGNFEKKLISGIKSEIDAKIEAKRKEIKAATTTISELKNQEISILETMNREIEESQQPGFFRRVWNWVTGRGTTAPAPEADQVAQSNTDSGNEVEAPAASSNIQDQIYKIYADIFKISEFDLELSSKIKSVTTDKSAKEAYLYDVNIVDTKHRGTCRQFSNKLIFELKKIGVEAFPLIIDYTDYAHVATLYKLGDKFFVADLGRELQYCQDSPSCNKSNPQFHAFPLKSYLDIAKENKGCRLIGYATNDISTSNTPYTKLNYKILYSKS